MSPNSSQLLKQEADNLLTNTGILKTLTKYGRVEATGSYLYNLMTWRDIDLCLTVDKLSAEKAFNIGAELASLEGIATMYFRNELVLETEGNPKAIFWCLEILFENELWKVDILIASEDVTSEVMKPGRELMEKLSDDHRGVIISLKSELCKDPGYRKDFRSVDIYNAVIDDGVKNLEQWNGWLERSHSKR